MFAVKEMHIHISIYIPEIKRILLTRIMLRDKAHKCDFNRPRQARAGYVSTAGHLDGRDCNAPGKNSRKQTMITTVRRACKIRYSYSYVSDDIYRC
jgi:hypothetical protein